MIRFLLLSTITIGIGISFAEYGTAQEGSRSQIIQGVKVFE